MTREQKMQALINVLGLDEAMKVGAALTDDAASGDDAAAKAAADEAAATARLSSTNPFVRGSKHFSLAKQGELLRNPKTRKIGISLAKSAGQTIKDELSERDLYSRVAQ